MKQSTILPLELIELIAYHLKFKELLVYLTSLNLNLESLDNNFYQEYFKKHNILERSCLELIVNDYYINLLPILALELEKLYLKIDEFSTNIIGLVENEIDLDTLEYLCLNAPNFIAMCIPGSYSFETVNKLLKYFNDKQLNVIVENMNSNIIMNHKCGYNGDLMDMYNSSMNNLKMLIRIEEVKRVKSKLGLEVD